MQKVSEEKKVLLSHVSQIVKNLIQGNSLYHGLILVSHDSDMRRVSDITLEDWLQPEY